MGVTAALIAGVVAAGAGVAGSMASSSAAKKAAGQFNNLSAPNVKPVKFDRLSLSDPWQSLNSYFQNANQYLPQANGLAQAANQDYQKGIYNTIPGLKSGIAMGSNFTNSLLQGELSADTKSALSRSDAYKSLQGGMGGGSPGANALSARDLGLTTQQLQAQGQSLLGGEVNMGQALNPLKATDFMYSPTQLLQRTDEQTIANWQTANQEKAFNTSLQMENQNAAYQNDLFKDNIAAQMNMAQGASQQQMWSSIGSGVSAIAGGIGGIGGGTGMGANSAGIDWTKFGGQMGFGSGMYGNGFYASQGLAQQAGGGWGAAPGMTSPTTYYPGRGWSIGY